jgi:hypothetical protein
VASVWSVVGAGDFDGNGTSDIVWAHTSGARADLVREWRDRRQQCGLNPVAPAWVIQSTSAE